MIILVHKKTLMEQIKQYVTVGIMETNLENEGALYLA